MVDRPLIVGMNNPHSTDPKQALAPYPERVAGWRLWRMLSDVCGVSRIDYMHTFDRVNLLNERDWDAARARAASEGLWDALEGRTVLVLGAAPRNVLWLPESPPLLWKEHRGVRWCSVPHPSGLNRWYNEPLHRHLVGLRLESLYNDWKLAERLQLQS